MHNLFKSAQAQEENSCEVVEQLSTDVTGEDLANAWEDGFGVKYSKDKTRLLKAPYGIKEYSIIPETKVICNHAFSGCSSLQYIGFLSNSVTRIGYRAFSECKSLQSISIPNSVTSIGEWAFEDCNSLQYISLSNSVTEIESMTFKNCNSLQCIH